MIRSDLPKNANMAQLVEHILGKDEVPGSNPGISLKRRHLEIGAIFMSGRPDRQGSACVKPVFEISHDRGGSAELGVPKNGIESNPATVKLVWRDFFVFSKSAPWRESDVRIIPCTQHCCAE